MHDTEIMESVPLLCVVFSRDIELSKHSKHFTKKLLLALLIGTEDILEAGILTADVTSLKMEM